MSIASNSFLSAVAHYDVPPGSTVCPYELLKQIAFLLYNVLQLTAAETVHLWDSTLKQYYKYSLN